MLSNETRIFPIQSSYAPVAWIGCVVAGIVAAGSLFFFATSPYHGHLENLLAGSLLVSPIAAFSVYCGRAAWRAPLRSVTVDKDGLWMTRAGKELGLVPWSEVAVVRARIYSGVVALLDERGACLLELDTNLTDFSELFKIVMNRVAETFRLPTLPAVFPVTLAGHLHILLALFGVLMGALFGMGLGPAFGILWGIFFVGGPLWLYSQVITKLSVREEGLVIRYPLRTRTLAFADIKAMEMKDLGTKGFRPFVMLRTDSDRKPILLGALGYGAPHLYLILARLLANTPCVVS